MADPFVAEIRMFAGNFAPTGWALCNGQLLPISQNTALFSLLGTFYGGDGRVTFGLPDLQGNTPVQQGQSTTGTNYDLGEASGSSTVQLLATEMPLHTHGVQGNFNAGDVFTPSATTALTNSSPGNVYLAGSPQPAFTPMSQAAIGVQGGGQQHNNMMPYLVVTFIIALQGIFPPRS
jgi:microcystin-dependent protein